MNSLEGFKDFDKVIRPFIPATNHGPRYTLPSIWVSWVIWQQMVSADFCGIFEISNRKFTAKSHRYEDTIDMLSCIEKKLPCDVFVRMHVKNHKDEHVIVKLLGWCRDKGGNPIIQIEHSERFCYTTPIAGSMGGEKPEPQ